MRRALGLLAMLAVAFVVVYGVQYWFDLRDQRDAMTTEIHLLHYEIGQLKRQRMDLIEYIDEMSKDRPAGK